MRGEAFVNEKRHPHALMRILWTTLLGIAMLAILTTCGGVQASPDGPGNPDASGACRWDQGTWDHCQLGP